MSWLHQALDFVRHLSDHLNQMAEHLGPWTYVVLFLIVFCETGLVVTPFLPGDSLLLALGAVAASGHSVNLPVAIVVLCIAANCGDFVNYFMGYRLGPKVFSRQSSWLLNRKHLDEAQAFYDRHGRKTIILARFVPIIRTFAPFVAGIGKMRFSRFATFSIAGGIFWVVSVSLAGYFFGNIPFVKRNFELVIVAVVVVSVLPAVLHALRSRRQPANGSRLATDQFIAMTQNVIADDGFENYLPTLFLPSGPALHALEGIPADVSIESAARNWAAKKCGQSPDDYHLAFKISDTHFKVVSRVSGVVEERVAPACPDGSE